MRALGHWTRTPLAAPVSEPPLELVELAELIATPDAAPAERARLLANAGFPMVAEEVVADAGAAVAAAERLGFPVVLKGLHPAATHKSELGLVHLDLNGPAAVRDAFAATVAALEAAGLAAEDAEVVLQPHVAAGIELVAGIRNDTPLGTVLVVGLGGLHVEVIAEASVRIAPVDRDTALEMLGETPALRLLGGVRGASPADVEAVVDAIVALSHLGAAGRHVLRSLEVNPLVAHERGKGALGVDLVVELQPEGPL
jgi:succinyl-CoA synthetase beta subunit